MQSFSAFSSDKNGENYEFTWVSFINLSPIHEEYLAADKYVEVHGDLQLDVFKGELQLECKVKSIAPWELNKTACILCVCSIGSRCFRHLASAVQASQVIIQREIA